MTDQTYTDITPPVNMLDWTQICVSHSLSDISEWYDDTTVETIDRWLIPNFKELVANKIIYVSFIRAADDVMCLLKDFDAYRSRPGSGFGTTTHDSVVSPYIVIGIHFGVNLTGDYNWTGPKLSGDHDWFIETSDIFNQTSKHMAESFTIIKDILSVIRDIIDATDYTISKVSTFNQNSRTSRIVETLNIKNEA